MKYLILGAGGMAGHMIACYLKEQGEEVIGVARRNLTYCETHILDVTNFLELGTLIASENYDIIVNCIGILNSDVDANLEQAILVNSYLPHFLVKITKDTKTRIIHMSTDCVFSGKKGAYSEVEITDGITNYDRTKALGEINDDKNLTFRNSIIGPDININGIGLFNWFMKQEVYVNGYEKSIWTGVTTLTLAKAIHKASYTNLTGLYHLVNNYVINKYELLLLFNKCSNKRIRINKVDGVLHDKSLINNRTDFEFIVDSYERQIMDMFEWIDQHQNLYPHYFFKKREKIS